MSIPSTLTKRFIDDIKLELPDAEILIGMAEERLQAILDAELDDAVDREMASREIDEAFLIADNLSKPVSAPTSEVKP